MTVGLHQIIERQLIFKEHSYEEIDELRYLNERIRREQLTLLDLQDEGVKIPIG